MTREEIFKGKVVCLFVGKKVVENNIRAYLSAMQVCFAFTSVSKYMYRVTTAYYTSYTITDYKVETNFPSTKDQMDRASCRYGVAPAFMPRPSYKTVTVTQARIFQRALSRRVRRSTGFQAFGQWLCHIVRRHYGETWNAQVFSQCVQPQNMRYPLLRLKGYWYDKY